MAIKIEAARRLAGKSFNPDSQFHSKKEWEDHAKKLGYEIEPDGSDNFVAHENGEEKGQWLTKELKGWLGE
jgi:hypothetical protein